MTKAEREMYEEKPERIRPMLMMLKEKGLYDTDESIAHMNTEKLIEELKKID